MLNLAQISLPNLHYLLRQSTFHILWDKRRVTTSEGTKSKIYKTINPELITHPVYHSRQLTPEAYRISFTRLRLTSHNLRSETGRWSRLPVDRRLCPCGGIQDEEHIITSCPKTQALRTALSNSPVFPDFLSNNDDVSFKYIHEALNFDYNSWLSLYVIYFVLF